MPGFLLVAILVLLGAGLLGTLFRQKLNDEMHRPLGPTLPVFATAFPLPVSHTGEPAELPSISPTLPAGDSENNPDLGNTPSAIPATLEPTPAPLCDGPPQMTILAIGADSVDSEYEYGLADVIRVVRVDFVTPGVSVLTVPRGLWVAIPALGNGEMARYLANYYGAPLDPVSGEPISLSVAHGLINVSYFYGNLFDLPGLGPATLAHTLYYNTGVTVDHYVAINMQVLASVVDRLGGVDVNVPEEVTLGTMVFPEGIMHMSGQEALLYSRIREIDNDWYRSQRQDQVLEALRVEITRPRNIGAIPGMIDDFSGDILTDLSRSQIVSLACLAAQIEPGDIQNYTISPDMITFSWTTKGFEILLPDEQQIRELVAQFMIGEQQ